MSNYQLFYRSETPLTGLLRWLVVVNAILIVPNSSLTAQAIHPGLSGQELLDALVQDYKPSQVLTLAQAKDSIYASIDIQGDSVYGFYTDFAVYLTPGQDPSQAVFQNGNGINLEHGWPQSKGATEGTQAHSDMHHLFPTRVAVNSARGSFPFREIDDVETTTWFYRDAALTSIPINNIDAYSESANGAFEPRESVKGDIARAMFYFYTMYREQVDASAPDFFDSQVADLCNWHQLDPADSRETNRTENIADFQDGHANPFVLDCTLARRAYCPDLPSCSSASVNINESHKITDVQSQGCAIHLRNTSDRMTRTRVEIFDIAGQRVLTSQLEQPAGEVVVYDACYLPAGLYVVQLHIAAGQTQYRAVHKVYIQ